MEDEAVVTLAEVLEVYESAQSAGWEKEFQPVTEQGERACTTLVPRLIN